MYITRSLNTDQYLIKFIRIDRLKTIASVNKSLHLVVKNYVPYKQYLSNYNYVENIFIEGHVELLDHIYQTDDYVGYNLIDVRTALINGHVNILIWLRNNKFIFSKELIFDYISASIYYGEYDILLWIDKNLFEISTLDNVDISQCSNINIVKWLMLNNIKITYTAKFINNLVCCNDMDSIKWFKNLNLEFKYSEIVIEHAIQNNNIDMLTWFMNISDYKNINNIATHATYCDSSDIFEWIIDSKYNIEYDQKFVSNAIGSDSVRMLELLDKHFNITITDDNIKNIIELENIEILNWIIESGRRNILINFISASNEFLSSGVLCLKVLEWFDLKNIKIILKKIFINEYEIPGSINFIEYIKNKKWEIIYGDNIIYNMLTNIDQRDNFVNIMIEKNGKTMSAAPESDMPYIFLSILHEGETLKWLVDVGFDIVPNYSLITMNIGQRNYEMLKFIQQKFTSDVFTHEIIAFAIEEGDVDILNLVIDLSKKNFDPTLCNFNKIIMNICIYGYSKMLTWFELHNIDFVFKSEHITVAIMKGQFKIIKWIKKRSYKYKFEYDEDKISKCQYPEMINFVKN